MGPPSSVQIPRVRTYSGYRSLPSHFAYRALTFSDWASHPIRLCFVLLYAVQTPGVFLLPVWPLSRSLAATCEISVDFSSSAYLDVSVRQVPSACLLIQHAVRGSSPRGFPHSDICGSKLICSSPRLIAACHVLRRLPVPRHSPCALFCLNFPFRSVLSFRILELL